MKTALVFTLLAAVILLSAGASAPLTLTAVDKKSSANSVAELSNSEIDTSVHYKKKKKRCRTYCVKYKKKYCKKCRYKKKCKKVNKCVRYCKNKYGWKKKYCCKYRYRNKCYRKHKYCYKYRCGKKCKKYKRYCNYYY